MRKIITSLCLLLSLATVSGKDYTDQLTVTVNEESYSQEATISLVENENGTYTLSLKNFILYSENSDLPVGNITLEDIDAIVTNHGLVFDEQEDIYITNGDDEEVDFWIGPMLCEEIGAVPISLRAVLDGEKLYAVIDIDLTEGLGQIINVQFSTPAEEDEYTAAIESVTVADKEVSPSPLDFEDGPDYVKFFTADVELSHVPTIEEVVVKTVGKNPYTFIEVQPAKENDFGVEGINTDCDYLVMVGNYAADLKSAEGWFISVTVVEDVINYDLNGDGKISTADIQVIINEMKKPADSQNKAYDLNSDGKISTADIQVIINEMKK